MASGPAQDVNTPKRDAYRLPTDLKPTHYDVVVRTDLEKLRFDGYVVTRLDVVEDTSAIVFNTAKLGLKSARVSSASLKQEIVRESSVIAFDEDNERATIKLPTTLAAGTKVVVKIDFESELTGSMMGYYRSAYEVNGKTEYYALTQFAPTAARKAFPCWDEPLFKATFSLTMISRENTVNLNNMPAISEEVYSPNFTGSSELAEWLKAKFLANEEAGKWKVTRFETTPPMSSYIIAFANGPFKYIEDSYVSPLSGTSRPLRIYATADLIHQAQFALDVKKAVLPIYEKIFDIEYPLPKLDTLVATDLDASAMENWGLITGRTNSLLLDPEKADLFGKKRVAVVQSHEVAHMWFGNITTMEWWDNLYLNEGFASLMGEVIVLDKVFPEWKVHSSFISEALASGLALDSKLSSHPIEVACPDAKMINQMFDALSYSKAASVLRMLSVYVGIDEFLKGVSIYLKKHLYSNSVTKDLWEGIQEASGVDVPKMMDNWVKKMGYPLVSVTEVQGGIKVRQDRFLESGPAKPEDNETIWTVPLSLVTTDASGKPQVDRAIVLDEREKFIPLDTSNSFKLNGGTTGVYRVLYSPERLVNIAKETAKPDGPFTLEDRVGFVYDTLALAKAGYIDVSAMLSLYDIFRDEEEFLVWGSIAGSLGSLTSTWYEHKDIVDQLNTFREELFGPLVARLGYEYPDNESVDTRQLRTKVIEQAADAGVETVIAELISRFKRSTAGDESAIPPDLVRITYSIAVAHGGRAEYDTIKAEITTAKNPSIKVSAMCAIGATKDLALAEETWEHVMTKSRDQDIFYYFAGLHFNPKTRHFLVQSFRKNYDALYDRVKDSLGMNNLINFAHAGLASQEDYDETFAFFQDKDTSKFKLALQQNLDGIKARVAWIERSTGNLRRWLEGRQK